MEVMRGVLIGIPIGMAMWAGGIAGVVWFARTIGGMLGF